MVDRETINERYEEELSDAKTYDELSEKCEKFGNIFKDIANEERTHARLMKFILDHIDK